METGATHLKQADEQAIRQLVDTWLEASKTGDLETVLSLMSDDVIFMDRGAVIERAPPDRMFLEPTEARTRAFLERLLEPPEIRPVPG